MLRSGHRRSSLWGRCALEAVLLSALCLTASAQDIPARRDTLPLYTMEAIVVTADRIENRIANTTSAVSFLSSSDMARLPIQKFSDVFRTLPGFFVVDRDGLGRDPIVNARGFYGGGEAEYLLVLVDGKPVNDLETGLVNWNIVPLAGAEAVEVVRGASSSLYGDASLGGVINIITSTPAAPKSVLSLEGGSYGTLDAGLKTRGSFGGHDYSLFATNERTKGFRDHSVWEGTTFGGDVTLLAGETSRLRLSTIDQWIHNEVPGPLTLQEADADPGGSSPYYKFDNRDEEKYQVQLGYSAGEASPLEFTAEASYRYRASNIVRTFTDPSPLVDLSTYSIIGFQDTSLFGDTKERELRDNEAALRLKCVLTGEIGPLIERFVSGIDGDYGDMRNHYYSYFSGFDGDYARASAGRGPVAVEGTGTRGKYAIYLQNELRYDLLTLVLAIRYDAIHDNYTGSQPDTSLAVTSTRFSPKFGLNVNLTENPEYAVKMYGNVSRSFKAPTLDQLTDRRPLDIMTFFMDTAGHRFSAPARIPPFSNGSLRPQSGVNYELGTYARLAAARNLSGELSLAVYQTDMEDEIDFDFATYRYQNVGRSRHRGFEGSLRVYWMPHITAFANYTWTDVRFRSGPENGKYLKGIPQSVLSLGLSYEHESGFGSALTWYLMGGSYLDDENTAELPASGTASLKLSWKIAPLVLFAEGENIFDRRFNSNGYLLYGTTYVYPSAGRVIHGGINIEF